MEELDVRAIACFKSVATVIGESEALMQLSRVYSSGSYDLEYFKNKDLSEAFIWWDYPQGDDYWTRIYCNPSYEELYEQL